MLPFKVKDFIYDLCPQIASKDDRRGKTTRTIMALFGLLWFSTPQGCTEVSLLFLGVDQRLTNTHTFID